MKTAECAHEKFVGSCGHLLEQCRCSAEKTETPVPVLCPKCLQACADETDPNPTEAQKASGNYKKGRCRWHGLDLVFENAKGSTRSGVDKDGKAWSTKMQDQYGYIRGTESEADGDHVDIFVCDEVPHSDKVYVVNQNDPSTGQFDESKVILGTSTTTQAKEVYLRNYDKGWKGFDDVVEMTIPQFKDWLTNGDTGRKITKTDIPKDAGASRTQAAT